MTQRRATQRLLMPSEASRDTWRVRVPILVDVDWRRKLDSTHLLAVASSGLNGPAFGDISQSIGRRTASGKIGTVAAMLQQQSNAADRARVAPWLP